MQYLFTIMVVKLLNYLTEAIYFSLLITSCDYNSTTNTYYDENLEEKLRKI